MSAPPGRTGPFRSWHRVVGCVRDAFAIAGITLFLLLTLELAARAVYRVRNGTTDPDMKVDPAPLHASDYSPSWNDDYIPEFRNSGRLQWEPYVYWRRMPFTGRYINVDANGHRQTYNVTPQSEAKTRIFVFGGSAVWGPWTRDDYTIPSDLSRLLQSKGYPGVHVTNLAESGHVSTQNVLTLMRQLREGNKPDIAVFYEGVNDVFSAFQNREAGIPLNESHRRREFNASKKPARLIALLLRTSMVAQAVQKGLGKIVPTRPAAAQPAPATDPLVDATVDAYLANIRIVNALSEAYGFKAFFFVQPSLFSKRARSPVEDDLLTQYPPDLVGFFDRVYGRMAAVPPEVEHLHDLQHLFDDDPETVFVDYTHIREPKNERVAEAIGDILGHALVLPSREP